MDRNTPPIPRAEYMRRYRSTRSSLSIILPQETRNAIDRIAAVTGCSDRAAVSLACGYVASLSDSDIISLINLAEPLV
jgi:hypothetical protein